MDLTIAGLLDIKKIKSEIDGEMGGGGWGGGGLGIRSKISGYLRRPRDRQWGETKVVSVFCFAYIICPFLLPLKISQDGFKKSYFFSMKVDRCLRGRMLSGSLGEVWTGEDPGRRGIQGLELMNKLCYTRCRSETF